MHACTHTHPPTHPPAHTHIHTRACTHTHTHTHTHKKAKSLAAAWRSCRPSEALVPVHESGAMSQCWQIHLEEGWCLRLNHAQGDGVGTQGPTWTTPISGNGQQFDICFPSYYQVPIDVTAG